MRLSRRRFWLCSYPFTLASFTLLSTFAQAADLGLSPKPMAGQSWTGFSLGVGGGFGFLNANADASASRTDDVGCAGDTRDCTSGVVLREIKQGSSSSLDDLGATGGFFTLQGAYDYQFAPRWVAGAFVDADWSDIGASAKRTNDSSVTFLCPDTNNCEDQPNGSFVTSNSIIRTKISTDWNVSVGGRIGWLANPDTLLYFLAAYTHAELGDAQVKATIPDPNELIGVVLGGSPSSSPFPNSPTTLLMKLPDSLDGWTLGGGGEAKIGGPWSIKLEYRWTHLEGGSAHATSSTSQCCFADSHGDGSSLFRDISSKGSAALDLDEQTVRGALVYHFWSGGGPYGG